jgi:two-component system, OmpR family, sensor kinase
MSIRLRLTIYWALILAAILLVACIAGYQLFANQRWGTVDAALLEEADTSARQIAEGRTSEASEVVKELSNERDLGAHRQVRLVTAEGVVADFGNSHAKPRQLDGNFQSQGIFTSSDGSFHFAVMPLTFNGQNAYLEDGVEVTPIRASIRQFLITILIVVPIVLVLSVAGGYWLVGRALEPITLLSEGLAAIQPKRLDARLPPPPIHDEVARLTEAINALLSRLESASIAERRFASDAAHELRTPLATLRTGLEVALARPRSSEENLVALQTALSEVIAMCKMADDLLMLARLDRETTLNSIVLDLSEIAGEVAANIEPVAHERRLQFMVDLAHGALVRGNPPDLRRVVINLLDNAFKFAPGGGEVGLSVTRNGNSVMMRVIDNGPGIPAADLPLIFERFYRSKSARAEGSGLGLSLCKEVVRHHNGQIAVANLSHGGCEAVVTLPAATQ